MPTQLTVASAADMVKVFEQGNLPTPLLLQDLCLLSRVQEEFLLQVFKNAEKERFRIVEIRQYGPDKLGIERITPRRMKNIRYMRGV